ncbi:uncharacterized protein LOC121656378 [Melanotaenia boesemani]|uniref:uncharacterized protein LOC121656378 n=1 Tax=Melanotaenia boesemani TaxID=1250792 RepID=UPI001C051AD4|nr:uncharacterized protein LOC121656378 [Melanotaenia boesemani]
MKWESMFLILVLFSGWCFHLVTGDTVASDEESDAGQHEDVHFKTVSERKTNVLDMNSRTSRDIPDTRLDTNWNMPDTNNGNYEDADWHPSTSMLETHSDLNPSSPRATGTTTLRGGNAGVDHASSQNLNHTSGRSPAQCGEYSSRVTSGGQCRLTATLPPVGTTEKYCPDMFRCTDDISFWLHENQNRKEQLEELRETMSELQEELWNHRHRVKVLEMQVE